MFHPTLYLPDYFKQNNPREIMFDIVQIGTGGNGGYLTQRLAKMIYSFMRSFPHRRYRYTLVDGDRVEDKNLLRQPFIEEDLEMPKAQILAERYSNAYDITICFKDSYMESVSDIEKLFTSGHGRIPVLLGCVDNNATRQLMHEFFEKTPSLIYIDSGIDAVLRKGTSTEIEESGYSGQVVCGVKLGGKVLLEPAGHIYNSILEDKDSILPTQQACGEQVVYYPQRMQTNEAAALAMTGYLNTLLSDLRIVSHYTNFNAYTNLSKPTYITKEQLAI